MAGLFCLALVFRYFELWNQRIKNVTKLIRLIFVQMTVDLALDIAIERVAKSHITEVDFDNIPFGKIFSDHMFVADFDGEKWGDLRISPYGPMELSPAISALHYGQAIFEGLKAYRNQAGEPVIFRPRSNWNRMNKSAQRLCMPAMPEEIFIEGLKALVRLDEAWVPQKEDYSLYIRPFMFAMDEYVGVRPSETYRFVIFTCPVGPYYSAPVKVRVSDAYVRAFPRGTGYAKSAGNYAAAMLPQKLAKQEGYDQLIWLDGEHLKYVEESGTMNLFFVLDNVLITPVADGTILEGITRDSILKLARDLGISADVRKIEIEEIRQAHIEGRLQDAFGTGTAATIAHIAAINYNDDGGDRELPPVTEREISNRLREALDAVKTGKSEDIHHWLLGC
jgi:branched-chain amino acid aminotransferase